MSRFYKIFIFISIVILGIYTIYFINEYNKNLLSGIKKHIPLEIKQNILKYVFYIPELKKTNIKLTQENKLNIEYIEKIENKIIEISNLKSITNEEIFPQTQFTNLKYNEINLNLPEEDRNPPYIKNGNKTSSFYIEIVDDGYLITTKNSNTYLANPKSISTFENIQNNLPTSSVVTDTRVDENFIYIMYSIKDSSCGNFFISKSKINKTKLIFENIYSNEPNNPNQCQPLGGRIELDKKNKILFFTSKNNNYKSAYMPDQYLKNNEYKFAMIGKLDLNTLKAEILSTGHRNPQGLLYTSDGYLISTEHGPRGGDEINLILEGNNYGWPSVSYGENYRYGYEEKDDLFFKKSHEDYNFQEPIFAFVPSIGISQIIDLDNSFSKKWQNNFIVSSLRSGSLFRIKMNKNKSKILFYEKIKIGKRIRDLNYDKKNQTIVLALENDKGSIGLIKISD